MFLFFFVVARGHRDRYARWLFYSPCKTGGPAAHSAGTGCTQALRAAYAPTRGVDGSYDPQNSERAPARTPYSPSLNGGGEGGGGELGALEPKWVRKTYKYIVLHTCILNVFLDPFCSLANAVHKINNIYEYYYLMNSYRQGSAGTPRPREWAS